MFHFFTPELAIFYFSTFHIGNRYFFFGYTRNKFILIAIENRQKETKSDVDARACSTSYFFLAQADLFSLSSRISMFDHEILKNSFSLGPEMMRRI